MENKPFASFLSMHDAAEEVNVLEFDTYEEYLDQFVTSHDLFYLENQDDARKLVELGYKGKVFLSREEFAAAREVALHGPLQRKDSRLELCSTNYNVEDNAFLKELAKREELVRAGKLATIIYLRDTVRGQEVSAYIDYGERLHSENFNVYFSKEKKMQPQRNDLSYYNWKTHVLFYNNNSSSSNFQIIPDLDTGELLFRHKRDRKIINVDPKAASPGENSNRTVLNNTDYLQVTIFDHVVRRKN